MNDAFGDAVTTELKKLSFLSRWLHLGCMLALFAIFYPVMLIGKGARWCLFGLLSRLGPVAAADAAMARQAALAASVEAGRLAVGLRSVTQQEVTIAWRDARKEHAERAYPWPVGELDFVRHLFLARRRSAGL